ncbi:peptide-methionine (R)-S-oxide reductase MsrB, partial [Patescibacteria group bacterium]|nr:peptide-methionine (R)-S-oxide reductase MsrB [Patescibacteria group bacterium]
MSDKKELTPEQHKILREKGTEVAFSGKYVNHKKDGTYVCADCGHELFSSDAKFESGTGWPSFSDVVASDKVKLEKDTSLDMERVEVMCANCGGHLGHV